MRLVVIWTIFAVYLAIIIYIVYNSSGSNTIQSDPFITNTDSTVVVDSTFIIPPSVTAVDSLVRLIDNALNTGNIDQARRYYKELLEIDPDSRVAGGARQMIEQAEEERRRRIAAREKTRKNTVTNTRKTSTRSDRQQKENTRIAELQQKISNNNIRLENALSRMRTVNNDQQRITWYYIKNVSHYVYKNSFETYIGQSDEGDIWLRMRIYYNGDKWLDIDTYELYADDKLYTISTLYGNMERGRGRAGAWEWFDMKVSAKEIDMIEAVMEAGRSAIRYIGESGSWDRTMTEGEKLRLKYVMDAYNSLQLQSDYNNELVLLRN